MILELPLLRRALEETFGGEADQVRLRDLSDFEDGALSSLMEPLYDELLRTKASPLRVRALAQLIAVLERSLPKIAKVVVRLTAKRVT